MFPVIKLPALIPLNKVKGLPSKMVLGQFWSELAQISNRSNHQCFSRIHRLLNLNENENLIISTHAFHSFRGHKNYFLPLV